MTINSVNRADVEYFDHYTDKSAIDEYQRLATRSAVYPGAGMPLGLMYVALKLNGEAGELAEHVGKAVRDDHLVAWEGRECEFGDLKHDRRELIIKEIGDCLWYLSAACNELDISLSEAAVMNLRKLADRSERNKLQGSGDER